MEIKVVGSGCANCKRLLQMVERIDQELKANATIQYVTDIVAIAETGILKTPGLIINGKIVSYGRVPSIDEVKMMISSRMV